MRPIVALALAAALTAPGAGYAQTRPALAPPPPAVSDGKSDSPGLHPGSATAEARLRATIAKQTSYIKGLERRVKALEAQLAGR